MLPVVKLVNKASSSLHTVNHIFSDQNTTRPFSFLFFVDAQSLFRDADADTTVRVPAMKSFELLVMLPVPYYKSHTQGSFGLYVVYGARECILP